MSNTATTTLATKRIAPVIAGGVLALFVVLWSIVCWQTWTYTPTADHPTLPLLGPMVTAIGTLATTVTTGTAAVLGIALAKPATGADGTTRSLVSRVTTEVNDDRLTRLGVYSYLLVGVAVCFTWIMRPAAPEVVATFGLSVLGWGSGAFAAVFRSDPV
ncbi:MAG: hypothetical protein BWY91_00530 [bacterium ADurb.BinA028]|mgnify:CR=1 FL=1|jgi:dolichol kinase|nr:MAG: hypothetical protein BWY91_00530 [bacterium ADurb.BinA028]HNV15645.1 hypothetical protein [Dermatophilaceae bacterium]HRC13122.1 hypothetical protein [Dermatophilaceae bacterium]